MLYCDYCGVSSDTMEFILDPLKNHYLDICDSCLEENKESIKQTSQQLLKDHDLKWAREQTRRKKRAQKDPKVQRQGRQNSKKK